MNIFVLKGQIKHKKKVMAYVQKLSKELKIDRMWSKVIFVKFQTVLDDESQGLCWGDTKEGYVTIQIARKSDGEKIPYEMMMQTLAHEMVHAKQYLRGELNGYSLEWKGQECSDNQYKTAPWEQEAYELEKKLYDKCF